MTGKECVDLVMARCSRDAPELRAKVLTEMILAQQQKLEGRAELPYWLLSERADTQTKVGEPRLFLPGDFLRESEDMRLIYVNADGDEDELDKLSWDDAHIEFDDTATGVPSVYTMRGKYLYLRPTPDAVYSIRLASYYARQPKPQDDVNFTNEWTVEAPELLIAHTGQVISAQYIKDPDLTSVFSVQIQTNEKLLNDAIVAFEEANRTRRMR